jgi:NAD(P)-dependent dehydrogenase (short-subunit alcohol dehydrogenase family)
VEPADVSKSGIGNEIAQCFVWEGAKVVIANPNKEAAEPADLKSFWGALGCACCAV